MNKACTTASKLNLKISLFLPRFLKSTLYHETMNKCYNVKYCICKEFHFAGDNQISTQFHPISFSILDQSFVQDIIKHTDIWGLKQKCCNKMYNSKYSMTSIKKIFITLQFLQLGPFLLDLWHFKGQTKESPNNF